MDIPLLLARLLLAGVFAVAGVAKLADLAGSRRAMTEFGVPARFAAPLGLLLPLAELAVAVALIPTETARWGAVGALALLLLFMAGIGVNLARGKTPDCHCFGQLHAAPAGSPTLARNAGLAAVAVVILWQGWDDAGASPVAWLGDRAASEVVALLAGLLVLGVLVAQGWLLLHLLRQNGRLLLRLEALEAKLGGDIIAPAPRAAATAGGAPGGLPVGTPAPTFSLGDLDGERIALETLRAAGKPVLLIFSDSNCVPCTALLPEIGAWQRDYATRLTIALVSRGTAEAHRAKSAEHGVAPILLQRDREIAQAYRAVGTPGAVVVRADGTIGSRVTAGASAIRALVLSVVDAPAGIPLATHGGGNGRAAAAGPAAGPVGQPAPAIALPSLTGETVRLTDFGGHPTLVLFWNPGCGFCQQMADDLKAWEANPPAGAPKLLIVATGTVAANQAIGFRSPVVLDDGFTTGRAFGARGTPAAVLIDAHGTIASDIAAGTPAVLALVDATRPQRPQSSPVSA